MRVCVGPASTSLEPVRNMIHRTRGRLGRLPAVVLFCLSLAASASPASATTRVITWNMHSRYANKTEATVGLLPPLVPLAGPTGLRSWVVLPNGYTSQRCWPVLYLLHQVGAPDAWLQQQIVYANLPAIVVIPGGGDTWYTNWWNSGARVPGFENWVFNELMPKVSKSFAVCPERNMHAIAGASMGGYGAVYLASQRPDYFGTVGSFSGVLDLADPVIQYGYIGYKQIWGPPGAAYEFGHDPTYLLPNLANTRIFASVGNGTPISSQSDDSRLAVGLEAVMRNQVTLFRAAAAKAHVPVHFDEHAGTHSQDNANVSLQDFMAYNPFAKVVLSPATWRYSTIGSQWRGVGVSLPVPGSADDGGDVLVQPRDVDRVGQRAGHDAIRRWAAFHRRAAVRAAQRRRSPRQHPHADLQGKGAAGQSLRAPEHHPPPRTAGRDLHRPEAGAGPSIPPHRVPADRSKLQPQLLRGRPGARQSPAAMSH